MLTADTQSREHARMQGLQVKSRMPAIKTQYSDHDRLKGMSTDALPSPKILRLCWMSAYIYNFIVLDECAYKYIYIYMFMCTSISIFQTYI